MKSPRGVRVGAFPSRQCQARVGVSTLSPVREISARGRTNAPRGIEIPRSQIADAKSSARVRSRRCRSRAELGLIPRQCLRAAHRRARAQPPDRFAAHLAAASSPPPMAAVLDPGRQTPRPQATVGGVALQQLAVSPKNVVMRARAYEPRRDVLALKARCLAERVADARAPRRAAALQNPTPLAAMRADVCDVRPWSRARRRYRRHTPITSQQIQNPASPPNTTDQRDIPRSHAILTSLGQPSRSLRGDFRPKPTRSDRSARSAVNRPPAPPPTAVSDLVLLSGIGGGIGVAFGLAVRTSYATAGSSRGQRLPVLGSLTRSLPPNAYRLRQAMGSAHGGGALALYARCGRELSTRHGS